MSLLAGGGSEFSRNPEDFVPKQERYGIYRGLVEDVADPEYRGRIRVRVDGVHDKDPALVPVETLEWAESMIGDGGGINYGDFNVPYILGDKVGIVYLQGRPDQPFYIGTWPLLRKDRQYRDPTCPEEAWRYHDANDVPQGSDSNPLRKPPGIYPKRRVIKTRHGHVIEISDEPGDYEIILRTPIGQKIWIRESLSTEGFKKFVRGIKIIDNLGNYIHMNTEDSLLDIYWDGDKREVITGNEERTIGGYRLTTTTLTDFRYAGGMMHDFGNPIDHN